VVWDILHHNNDPERLFSLTSTPVPSFIAITLRGGGLVPEYVKYYGFVTFFAVVFCSGYTLYFSFFLGIGTSSYPWTDFNHLWLKWRVPKDVPFRGFDDDPQL